MLTTEIRMHEAPSVPCGACGAPLLIDPTAPNVWCALCSRWSAVALELRLNAFGQLKAMSHAEEHRAEQAARAAAHRAEAETKRRASSGTQGFLAIWLVIAALTGIPVIIAVAVGLVGTLTEELEDWAAVLVMIGAAIVSLALLLGAVGAIWWFYRLFTRHRRRVLKRSEQWFGATAQGAAAVCGVCGAPLVFRIGEMAVTCGFCRSTVVAAEPHARRLIALALAQAQRATLEQAKAERQKIKAQLVQKRTQIVYMSYMVGGSMALVALPVIAALYAWRTITFSIEEQLIAISQEVQAEFGAGLDPAFEWLDAYWIGETPHQLRSAEAFQSQWSFEGVFHGRPVLTVVTTNWSDRVGTLVLFLLARPRDRQSVRLDRIPAHARAQSFGFSMDVSYPGIALCRKHVPAHELTSELLTALAQCAYEICEARAN